MRDLDKPEPNFLKDFINDTAGACLFEHWLILVLHLPEVCWC
jgi:hypothetical protein